MRTLLNIADDIPGLLKAALLFNGETISKGKISVAWLRDGEDEAMVDLSGGIEDVEQPGLTKPMKSYLSGMVHVGEFLKVRKTVDEDGVEADDIERAALLLAFPKVAQDAGAMKMLKSHLDALQNFGVIEKIGGDAASTPAKSDNASAPAKEAEPKENASNEGDDKTAAERREMRRERRRQEAEKAAASAGIADQAKASAEKVVADGKAAFGEAADDAATKSKEVIAKAGDDASKAVKDAIDDGKAALKLDPAVNDAISGGDAATGAIATQQAKGERRGFFNRT
ncbi:MAG: hypothetical protein ACU0DW_04470 [Shimia sp.]